jgi:hypothetical protein
LKPNRIDHRYRAMVLLGAGCATTGRGQAARSPRLFAPLKSWHSMGAGQDHP